MNRNPQPVSTTRPAIALAAVVLAASSAAYAQHHHGPTSHPVAAPVSTGRVIPIPVVEANSMMQRQRVFLFTPPPGSSAYGIGTMGDGHRVWALLPSCRQPNPDDPRDPCPVGRVVMEVIAGSGTIAAGEPQPLGNGDSARRVQSFVVPASVEQVRIKILRHSDGGVRYEAAVEGAQLGNLPAPEGQPRGPAEFAFTLGRYPAL